MSVKDVNIKNYTHCFFDDIINIKHFDPHNIKIDKKSYTNIPLCYAGYATIKNDLKIYSGNPLHLIFGEVNGYFEEINGKKVFNAITYY